MGLCAIRAFLFLFFFYQFSFLFVQFLLFVKYCARRIALGSRILLLASVFAFVPLSVG